MVALFPKTEIKDAVFNAIPASYTYNSQNIPALVIYANQEIPESEEKYPLITLGWLEPAYQGLPLANLVGINYDSQADELQVTRGVTLRQGLDINVYDNNDDEGSRCDSVAGDIYLQLQKLDLSSDNAVVYNVSPPRPLDIIERGYLRRRMIELLVDYSVTWQEIENYIQTINETVDVQQG